MIVLARLGHLEELAFGQAAGADQSEALEDAERSIDGCGVDALSLPSQRRTDLLGAQVAAGPARAGFATSRSPAQAAEMRSAGECRTRREWE